MQIIERKCEAQKGARIRSNLNFYVVLWTVGEKKTLDKLTDQPGNLIPLDRAGVPDLSVSGDNSDLVQVDPHDPTTTSEPEAPMQSLTNSQWLPTLLMRDRPDHEDRFLCAIEERIRKRCEQS
jgi:hypothetical protein